MLFEESIMQEYKTIYCLRKTGVVKSFSSHDYDYYWFYFLRETFLIAFLLRIYFTLYQIV